MQRLHLYCLNVLPAILDIGMGALIAVSTLLYFDQSIPVWAWFLGSVLALLPDLDIIPSILRGHPLEYDHHRTLWHRPILVIPITTATAFLALGSVWAMIAALCVTWHFVHDTGWSNDKTGIAWLWPLSNDFLSWYGFYDPREVIDHHEWLRALWRKPTTMSVSEIIVGIGALSLAFYLQPVWWPAWVVVGLLLLVVLYVWFGRSILD